MDDDPHDPGGHSRFPLPAGTGGSARFEGDKRQHRIWLERRWHGAVDSDEFGLWVCMNPSTAGADEDDPLVRKLYEFTKRYRTTTNRFVLMNVATYALTDPARLPYGAELAHADNLGVMRACAESAAWIVLACGMPPKSIEPYASAARDMLLGTGRMISALGDPTGKGWPRHPGRIGYDTPFSILS